MTCAFAFVAGLAGNFTMLIVIMKRRLWRDHTCFFLGNLALSDILKSGIVLPITLANLLIQNWIFGSFLCFFLPMMHSFPIHASMLNYMMIAVDRYRYIVHPMKSRVPAGLCAIAIWVVAVCVVLPYAMFIKYIDLGAILGDNFQGVGICWVNQEHNIEVYLRAMFVALYCLPLAIIAFLYIRVSAEIKVCEGSTTVSMHIDDTIHSASESSYQSRITWSTNLSEHRIEPEGASGESTHHSRYTERYHTSQHDQENDDEIDMQKEKQTQKYMITMVMLFAMCWCPVNILILVTHFVYENEDNSGHFDITYLTFTFIGFLSTCINPILFASWRMSDRTKDRLRGYFRFSNRRRSSGHSDINTSHSRPREILDHQPENYRQVQCGTTKSYV